MSRGRVLPGDVSAQFPHSEWYPPETSRDLGDPPASPWTTTRRWEATRCSNPTQNDSRGPGSRPRRQERVQPRAGMRRKDRLPHCRRPPTRLEFGVYAAIYVTALP